MRPARSVFMAVVAVSLLIGARPIAGDEQFPRGLMAAAEPRKSQSCTIETRPLSFGEYNSVTGTEVTAIGQVIYTCGKGIGSGTTESSKAIHIHMDRGYTSSYSDRGMLGPSFETLYYNIYLDATHRTIWGDGTNGTEAYHDAHPPKDTPVIVPAFGRIDPRQDVPAGPYADNILVSILF